MPNHVHRLTVHRISLPMRVKFRHAAAERSLTENLVVEAELGNGAVGYGESVPRPYVSGETLDSAAAAVRDVLIDRILPIRPDRFSDLLGMVNDLPFTDGAGRVIASARAAVELALLDAYSRTFRRSLEEIAGWMGSRLFRCPGSLEKVRYSAVISAGEPAKVRRKWRLQRLLRLGHFKFKVGGPGDREILEWAAQRMRRLIKSGRGSIRVDANAAFSPKQAADWIARMADLPIASLEQPMAREHDAALADLRENSVIPFMADESLVTPPDADRLIQSRSVDLFNIRISKNGGLLASLQLAERAAAAGLGCQLGCMVGETGILSAAGRWFLALVRDVRWAEGSFGRLLLGDDITNPSPRFALGGRGRAMAGLGLGVTVDAAKLAKYAIQPPMVIQL
ncbi:MAG: L-Ala-D/L-Glu epimerase [Phycisphaerae bacterium]|nr:L-Ala-D/L-Glu epimerase [Phycisphaerae bacterium]